MNQQSQTQAVTAPAPFDLVGFIVEYEAGVITEDAMIEGFAHLIKTGMAWTLQGSYGRMAMNLINAGLISKSGEIL